MAAHFTIVAAFGKRYRKEFVTSFQNFKLQRRSMSVVFGGHRPPLQANEPPEREMRTAGWQRRFATAQNADLCQTGRRASHRAGNRGRMPPSPAGKDACRHRLDVFRGNSGVFQAFQGALLDDPIVLGGVHFVLATVPFVLGAIHFVFRVGHFVFRDVLGVLGGKLFVLAALLFVFRAALFVFGGWHFVVRVTPFVFRDAPFVLGGVRFVLAG